MSNYSLFKITIKKISQHCLSILAYLNLIDEVRSLIPDVTLSSDFICGFCGETDEEFSETISLIRQVKYHTAFLFAYSMREVLKNIAFSRGRYNLLNLYKFICRKLPPIAVTRTMFLRKRNSNDCAK